MIPEWEPPFSLSPGEGRGEVQCRFHSGITIELDAKKSNGNCFIAQGAQGAKGAEKSNGKKGEKPEPRMTRIWRIRADFRLS